jgi:molybdenum cofactor synthesis domain-containing protein
MMDERGQPTAGLLLIGDELLSGRTRDKNFPVIAQFLSARGIDLNEVRVVSDVEDDIIAALNALRKRYTYVLTTGGIGPTHDDITADAIARAFGVKIIVDRQAAASLHKLFAEHGVEPNEARMRMARVPEGADLLINEKIRAPGFRIGNVFVMAGVPNIMRLMLDVVGEMVEGGEVMLSRSVRIERGEGDLAAPLADIQKRYGDISIGSYPFKEDNVFGANIVLRGRDEGRLRQALSEVEKLV